LDALSIGQVAATLPAGMMDTQAVLTWIKCLSSMRVQFIDEGKDLNDRCSIADSQIFQATLQATHKGFATYSAPLADHSNHYLRQLQTMADPITALYFDSQQNDSRCSITAVTRRQLPEPGSA
jgi:hypothetical protein